MKKQLLTIVVKTILKNCPVPWDAQQLAAAPNLAVYHTFRCPLHHREHDRAEKWG
jgi:hypothetical protein